MLVIHSFQIGLLCLHPALDGWPAPGSSMWSWECFSLPTPHQRHRATVLAACVVKGSMASALTVPPTPGRVSGPGRLPAQVLQRPGPAHEGGGHVWMLPARVCCELPVVGVETIFWELGSQISSWGSQCGQGCPPERLHLLMCAAQPGGLESGSPRMG